MYIGKRRAQKPLLNDKRQMIDKREFETVFSRHYDGMFRLAWRMLGDEAESKDVVSDVFTHLLSGIAYAAISIVRSGHTDEVETRLSIVLG